MSKSHDDHGVNEIPTSVFVATFAQAVLFECLCGKRFPTADSHTEHAALAIRQADRDDIVLTYNAHRILKIVHG